MLAPEQLSVTLRIQPRPEADSLYLPPDTFDLLAPSARGDPGGHLGSPPAAVGAPPIVAGSWASSPPHDVHYAAEGLAHLTCVVTRAANASLGLVAGFSSAERLEVQTVDEGSPAQVRRH